MATKLGRVVTYIEQLPSIKLHNNLAHYHNVYDYHTWQVGGLLEEILST